MYAKDCAYVIQKFEVQTCYAAGFMLCVCGVANTFVGENSHLSALC